MAARPGRDGRPWRTLASRFERECREAGEACWICGQPIDYEADATVHPDAFQPDHYYPVSTHPELALDPANLRASHRSCNVARGDGPPPLGLGRTSRSW